MPAYPPGLTSLKGSLLPPDTASYSEDQTSNAWTLRTSNSYLTSSSWLSEITCGAGLKLRRGRNTPNTPGFLILRPAGVCLVPHPAQAPTDPSRWTSPGMNVPGACSNWKASVSLRTGCYLPEHWNILGWTSCVLYDLIRLLPLAPAASEYANEIPCMFLPQPIAYHHMDPTIHPVVSLSAASSW